ncbi:uncharacterized protein LOC106642893 [Copidosoma floridanum]|uniref:uncharacterized protein LOC106642893 n=1 Tax=Copidosoma floridanum TaxID=29053 RepID=UPI0006C94F1A|nr:uncharacterized protein LOC106642893 [Copidosoma floridanum]
MNHDRSTVNNHLYEYINNHSRHSTLTLENSRGSFDRTHDQLPSYEETLLMTSGNVVLSAGTTACDSLLTSSNNQPVCQGGFVLVPIAMAGGATAPLISMESRIPTPAVHCSHQVANLWSDSAGASSGSACSSPDYNRLIVANGTAGGAAASPTNLGAGGTGMLLNNNNHLLSIGGLIDSPMTSPGSPGPSPEYWSTPRTARSDERDHHQTDFELISDKSAKRRNRSRSSSADLVADRGVIITSPERKQVSGRGISPAHDQLILTPSAIKSEDEEHQSQRNRKKHRRGRPRADELPGLMLEGSTSPSSIKCKYCERVFPRDKSLKAHEDLHLGKKPHLCDFPGCTRSFAQTGQLNTHQRLHTGERPFLCTEPGCGARFTHANRHCTKHPNRSLVRSPQPVLRPIGNNVSLEEKAWLERYYGEKARKTLYKSSKRAKSRSEETSLEQENVCEENQDHDDDDDDDEHAKRNKRPKKAKRSRDECTPRSRQFCESPVPEDEVSHRLPMTPAYSPPDSAYLSNLVASEDEDSAKREELSRILHLSFQVQESLGTNVTVDACQLPVTPIRRSSEDGNGKDLVSEDDEPAVEASDLETSLVLPCLGFHSAELLCPTPQSEDEERTTITGAYQLPDTPVRKPQDRHGSGRLNESRLILMSEEDEELVGSDARQLPVTPVWDYQDELDDGSPIPRLEDHEPARTSPSQLFSTPVSRSAGYERSLPFKKRQLLKFESEALAQPISWETNTDSGSGHVSEDLYSSAQWSLSSSRWTSPIAETQESQREDVLPMPQPFAVLSVPAEPCVNIHSTGNELRASVLRHVGRSSYDVPSLAVPTDQECQIEQVVVHECTVEDDETQRLAALALLNLAQKSTLRL